MPSTSMRSFQPLSAKNRTSHAVLRFASVLLASAAVLLSSRSASAQNQFSIDAEAAFASEEEHGDGWGVGARFGHEWDLVLISLTPELGVNYHAFSGATDAESFAVVGGGRVGIDFIIQPSAFLHAGIGHFGYETLTRDASQTGLAYEFGLALDFTMLPVIDFGAHAALAGVAGDPEENIDPLSWLAVGGHITFVFDGDSDDD
jgi:hypothetical protein